MTDPHCYCVEGILLLFPHSAKMPMSSPLLEQPPLSLVVRKYTSMHYPVSLSTAAREIFERYIKPYHLHQRFLCLLATLSIKSKWLVLDLKTHTNPSCAYLFLLSPVLPSCLALGHSSSPPSIYPCFPLACHALPSILPQAAPSDH